MVKLRSQGLVVPKYLSYCSFAVKRHKTILRKENV